jgi:hypothetical protein
MVAPGAGITDLVMRRLDPSILAREPSRASVAAAVNGMWGGALCHSLGPEEHDWRLLEPWLGWLPAMCKHDGQAGGARERTRRLPPRAE